MKMKIGGYVALRISNVMAIVVRTGCMILIVRYQFDS